jgi:hypothetical protein
MAADRFSVLFKKSVTDFQVLWKTMIVGILVSAVATVGINAYYQGAALQPKDMMNMQSILTIGAGTLVGMVVSVLTYMYLAVIAVRRITSPQVAVSQAISAIIPFVILSFWAAIRSYAWLWMIAVGCFIGAGILAETASSSAAMALGIIGALCAVAAIPLCIIYGPRCFLAFFIWLKEPSLSPLQAVDASISRSAGYWGKIVGNSILLSLCMMPIFMAISIITGMIAGLAAMSAVAGAATNPSSSIPGLIGAGAAGVLALLIVGFQYVFYSALTDTITANPMPKA